MNIVLRNKNFDLMGLDNFNSENVESVAKSVGFWGVIIGAVIATFKKVILPIWRFLRSIMSIKNYY